MATELLAQRDDIAGHLDVIRQRVPLVVSTFRDCLYERVRMLLAEHDVNLVFVADPIREVSIYAERSDIAEEVVRLARPSRTIFRRS